MSPATVSAADIQRRRAEDAREEQLLMGRAMAVMFAAAVPFVLIWVSMVGSMDIVVYISMSACLIFSCASLLMAIAPVPKAAFLFPLLAGVALQVLLSQHFERADAGFYLLMPAIYTAVFFWRERVICAVMLAICTAAFIATPLMVADDLARVVMTTPIFLGLVLTTGYLGSKSQTMARRKGRFQTTISSLLVALQERDGYTADHSEETVDLAMTVGDQLEISDEERAVLADVALLHDIGKIGIPNEILNKREGLSDHEWEFMKKHPEIGERIVAPVPGFLPVAKAIRHEHERWDGNGYPDGIAGEEIPLASRIVLVCDAFHAMITDRPYRRSIGLEEARCELTRHAGSQFDPRVVDALLCVVDAGLIPESVGTAAWTGVTNGAGSEAHAA